MKPKEWWITWNFTGSLAGVTENDRTSEYMTSVHVIEKSAYDESIAENEILKSKASQFKSTRVETVRVRDKFRAELEQAKLTLQAISKNSLENRAEFEQLRLENEKLKSRVIDIYNNPLHAEIFAGASRLANQIILPALEKQIAELNATNAELVEALESARGWVVTHAMQTYSSVASDEVAQIDELLAKHGGGE